MIITIYGLDSSILFGRTQDIEWARKPDAVVLIPRHPAGRRVSLRLVLVTAQYHTPHSYCALALVTAVVVLAAAAVAAAAAAASVA